MADTLPDQMTAIEMTGAGGADVLRSCQRTVPEPRSNEVLIKVKAAGVNGPDLMQRKGLYPPPKGASHLLGLEVSGEVVALGGDAGQWAVGDKICALSDGGGYAEYCAVDASHCLPIPDGVAETDAAGLPETYFTIWSNIFMTAGLCTGELFLVHGGAGGLGTTSVQLGNAFGAKVFATDSPEARCAVCRELGADQVIDYERQDFVEIVREAGGANVILDIVGGPYIERNIKAAAPDGRIVQLAFALGAKAEINFMPIMLKRLTYTGSTLRSRPSAYKADVAKQLVAKVWPLFGEGRLRTVTSHRVPLVEAAKAHEMMERAEHTGKILLIV